MSLKQYDLYLAGPFFNPAQVHLISSIEEAMTDFGIKYFSPRKSDESAEIKVAKAQGMTRDLAHRLVQSNIAALTQCRMVLGVTDWVMPKGKGVFAGEIHDDARGDERRSNLLLLDPIELNIADVGTVWELGYAFALGIPTVTVSFEDQIKGNIMLTETAVQHLQGWVALNAFLSSVGKVGVNGRY